MTPDEIVKLYLEGNKTLRDVAAVAGVSHETVRKILARAGHTARTQSEALAVSTRQSHPKLPRPKCEVCGGTCKALRTRYCSHQCQGKANRKADWALYEAAAALVGRGFSYRRAMLDAGFPLESVNACGTRKLFMHIIRSKGRLKITPNVTTQCRTCGATYETKRGKPGTFEFQCERCR